MAVIVRAVAACAGTLTIAVGAVITFGWWSLLILTGALLAGWGLLTEVDE